jgi:hypothetical protein
MRTMQPRREVPVRRTEKRDAFEMRLSTRSMLVVLWTVLASAGWLSIAWGGLS